MRGREDANIERLWLRAADWQQFPVFQHAQQFDLYRQWNVSQFVEEDGAAVGQRQQARSCLRRAGERAARVAEQLALDQVGIEGGDVDGQEGTIAASAVAMDGAGNEFLPVPLSPVMRTQTSRGAARAMRLKTFCIAGLRPTISSRPEWVLGSGVVSGAGWCSRAR